MKHYTLKFDENICTDCGNCSLIMPFVRSFAKENEFKISEFWYDKHEDQITSLITNCEGSAFTLATE